MGWLAWLRAGTSGILSIRSDASEQDLRDSLLDARVLSMSGPSDTSGSIISQEQQYVLRRIRDNPMWTLDRGTGFYQQERLNKKKASLLGAGRCVKPRRDSGRGGGLGVSTVETVGVWVQLMMLRLLLAIQHGQQPVQRQKQCFFLPPLASMQYARLINEHCCLLAAGQQFSSGGFALF